MSPVKPHLDSHVFARVLDCLSRQDYEEAARMARAISTPPLQVEAMVELGQALVAKGDPASAAAVLREAYDVISPPSRRIQWYPADRLALVQAWAGCEEDAIKTAQLIPDGTCGRQHKGLVQREILWRAIGIMRWILGDRNSEVDTVELTENPGYLVTFKLWLKEVGEVIAAPRSLLRQYEGVNDLTSGPLGNALVASIRSNSPMAAWEALVGQCPGWEEDERSRMVALVRLKAGDVAGAWALAASMPAGEEKEAVLSEIALARFRFDELPAKVQRMRRHGIDTSELEPFVMKWLSGADSVPAAEAIVASIRGGGEADSVLAAVVRHGLEVEDYRMAMTIVRSPKIRERNLRDRLCAEFVRRYVERNTYDLSVNWQVVDCIKDPKLRVKTIELLACTMAERNRFDDLRQLRKHLRFAQARGALSKKGRAVLEKVMGEIRRRAREAKMREKMRKKMQKDPRYKNWHMLSTAAE